MYIHSVKEDTDGCMHFENHVINGEEYETRQYVDSNLTRTAYISTSAVSR